LETYRIVHHFEKENLSVYPFRKEKYFKASKTFTNPALNKCMEAYTTQQGIQKLP
jgi:hypothetical protein